MIENFIFLNLIAFKHFEANLSTAVDHIRILVPGFFLAKHQIKHCVKHLKVIRCMSKSSDVTLQCTIYCNAIL